MSENGKKVPRKPAFKPKLTKGNQMKVILLSLIALAALSSVTSVFAQEEESPHHLRLTKKPPATVEARP